jgi:hypothetical protein
MLLYVTSCGTKVDAVCGTPAGEELRHAVAAHFPTSPGLYAGRTAGGHRHYRHPDRPALARRAGGAGKRAAGALLQQSQADRPGIAHLSRRPQVLSAGKHHPGPREPPGCFSGLNRSSPNPGAPWSAQIVAYLEETALADQLDLEGTFPSTYNDAGATNHPLPPQISPLWTHIETYKCPSTPAGMLEWVVPSTVGGMGIPGVDRTTMNYFGCMGGGLDRPPGGNKRASVANPGLSAGGQFCTCGTTGAPLTDGAFLFHWTNGFMHVVSSVDVPPGQKVKGKAVRDALDGTSNSILVGETIYQNMQINRGWGSSHRSKHGSNNGPGNITGTYRAINSGKQIYNTFSNKRTDQNIHNHLMNTCFGSLHPGGAQSCLGDGSVRFLNENLSLAIYRTLGAINDGRPSGGLQ